MKRTSRCQIVATATLAILWLGVLYAAEVGFPFSRTLDASKFTHERKHCYTTGVPKPFLRFAFHRRSDGLATSNASQAILLEDGKPLQSAHAPHDAIRAAGLGRYSDWEGNLFFSSSDNSDPRSNARRYELRNRAYLRAGTALSWLLGGFIGLVWLGPVLSSDVAYARERFGRLRYALRDPSIRQPLARAVLFIGVASVGVGICTMLWNTPLWVAGFASLVLAVLALRQLVIAGGALRRTPSVAMGLANAALVLASTGISIAAFEAYLGWLEASAVASQHSSGLDQTGSDRDASRTDSTRSSAQASSSAGKPELQVAGGGERNANIAPEDRFDLPPELRAEMQARRQLLSLPPEWELKRVDINGTSWAYSWHGVDHIFDDQSFRRRVGPFPAKHADTMRVLVAGDSMTYGAGIRAEWTYAAQLERALRQEYRVEILNLGVNGAQSEDILRIVESMSPELDPDLVIYGVCYNDFLPSGVGQYDNDYPFPFPEQLGKFLQERTRLARFLRDNYHALLRLSGLSMDFYDDILKDFNGYQKRFSADVRRMNEAVRARGLPPVIGMPLDQVMEVGGRGHRISQIAERLMGEAGFDVISLEPMYRRYDGRKFVVSRWEPHPDEEANSIYAAMLYDHLVRNPELQRFRSHKGATTSLVQPGRSATP